MKKSQPAPHIRTLAYNLFGQVAFNSWNCGSYHDTNHAMYVAEVLAGMQAKGHDDSEHGLFLTQVGLLHDVGPRYLGTGPSVFRTLDWMQEHKETLLGIMGWTERAFNAAQALIARTSTPFNTVARRADSIYDGHSPYSLYLRLLSEVDPEDRAQVQEDAQLLRFADGCANFCRDFPTASQSLADWNKERRKANPNAKRLDAVAMLERLASDWHWDERASREMNTGARVLSAGELFSILPYSMQTNLLRNRDLLALEREAHHCTQARQTAG